MQSYDIHIYDLAAWDQLVERKLDIVIDPLVFRLGQFFLEGKDAAANNAGRWQTIESDIGALVGFFDLLVLNKQLPAFNYHDTFDSRFDFDDRLGAVLNTGGDQTLVHVDVEHHMYRQVKAAAISQLKKHLEKGPLIPKTAPLILSTLDAVQYEWEPGLETLEGKFKSESEMKLARFLLGQLVFAGYAQQTGAPHVLAPKRSLMLTSLGLQNADTSLNSEAKIFDELGRRFRDAGEGWRNDELPWTPSFLPFLLEKTNRYREGPDVLLERAKELRSSKAVEKYRKLREALVSEDADRSAEARKELEAAADAVATSLDSNKEEMHRFRHVAVEVLPKAIGAAAGAVVGAMAAGPAGAAAGGLVGVVGEEALKPLQARLWGWFLDGLPFRSARKLLTRSARAERNLHTDLAKQLHAVWETGRRR